MSLQNSTNNKPDLPVQLDHFYGYGARACNGSTDKSFNYTLSTSYEFGRFASIFSPAQNDTYETSFLLKAGNYNFTFLHDKGTSRGIANVYLNDVLQGTIDCYSASTIQINRTILNINVGYSGTHTLKIRMLSKNASSTGFVFNCSAFFANLTSSQYSIRVNSGGSNYGDSLGNLWLADTYFTGGNAFDIEANVGAYTVSGTVEQTLYKWERSLDSGSFSYNIPIVPGIYTINLLFSENYHSAANQRSGTVALNGTNLLTNFDIFVQAGGKNKALIRTFTNRSLTACNLTFTAILINAIEVIKIG